MPVILLEMRVPQTKCLVLLLAIFISASICGTAQTSALQIFKVDPPSWWTRSSLNPVRLMIRGKNLSGARVQALSRGFRVVGIPKVNERGTYIFVNVAIAPNAQPGPGELRITTPNGIARASFEILAPLTRNGRFRGFSPADVMYLIMIDRFSDGDPTNNDPPQSRGIYDRKNKFYYHGGDLQGVIDRLPYLKDLGCHHHMANSWYDNYAFRTKSN